VFNGQKPKVEELKNMIVGCPKEIKNHEYRVGLTPGAAREYVAHGHQVLIETGAGAGIGADDHAYEAVGARIAGTAAEVFAKSDMVVKVKEPQPSEWVQLREGQILYTYLHLAPDPEQTKGLLASGVTGVAYETVTDAAGALPLLAPMSEVAGRLSIQAGATALQKAHGGRGVLLGGVPGVRPGKVVVIGGGVVGLHAAKMAVGLGADVTVLDRSLPRLRQLDDIFHGAIHTLYSSIDNLEREVFSADLVIGAVLIPGAAAPKLVTKAMLSSMKPGSVIVDVAIDQGGCFETSHATTHSDPTYVVDGVVHYCVANMPGAVPYTSTHALNNATLVHGLALADRGLKAIAEDAHLRNGLNVHRGKITNKAVAESLKLEMVAPADALKAA
jgi:alanine dehydrogenase